MHDDGEAEHRRLRVRDFRAREPAVGAAEDAVVVLDPDVIRRRRALHDAMRVLAAALVRLIGRRVLGAHALALAVPRRRRRRCSARGRRTRRRSARRRGCAGRRGPSGCRDSRRRRRPRTCGRDGSRGSRRAASCRRRRASGTGRPGSCRTRARRRAANASSDQTFMTFQGIGVLRIGSTSTTSSGFGGYFGTGRSSHVAPPSRERFILTPKWPMSCAACSVPSRSPSTIVTGSPSSSARSMRQSRPRRPSDEHSFARADEQLAEPSSASRKSLKNIDFAVCD